MLSNYQSFSVVGINLRVVSLCRNRNFIRPVSQENGTIRLKTEIGKVEKFSVWNGKFRTEYSEKKKIRYANSYFEP